MTIRTNAQIKKSNNYIYYRDDLNYENIIYSVVLDVNEKIPDEIINLYRRKV